MKILSSIITICFSILSLLLLDACAPKVTSYYNETKFQDTVEKVVQAWIRDHSLLPESYKPLKFSDIGMKHTFYNNREIHALNKYFIRHTFEIRYNKDSLTIATLSFELRNDFFIDAIHYPDSNLFRHQVFPPDYCVFINLYGRNLTAQDSASWEINHHRKITELESQYCSNNYFETAKGDTTISSQLIREIEQLSGSQFVTK